MERTIELKATARAADAGLVEANRLSALIVLAATLLLCGTVSSAPAEPTIRKAVFGTLPEGIPIESYTLNNGKGMSAKILTYGGIINELNIPDAKGALTNVVLSARTLDEYLRGFPASAAIMGRVANRIAGASFVLDGVRYKLSANNGSNHLHGVFGKAVWQARALPTTQHTASLELRYWSKAGEDGFPGNLSTKLVYTLSDPDELRLDFTATTDQATPVNLTSHAYFNLAGHGTALNHVLWLAAPRYTPADESMIPTGEIVSVKGTPLDFMKPTRIGARINDLTPRPGGYDHNLVLEGDLSSLKLAARLQDPASGRSLEVHTTEPGLQVYSANHLNHAAVCLETQHFPDSVHHTNFPSIILRPGGTFRSTTVFRFRSGLESRL
jgi:aldose 1-epimerase